jgi:Phosphatidylinositol N-acetylglucosaminyltransferase subunit Y
VTTSMQVDVGLVAVTLSVVFCVIAGYSVLFSAFVPLSGNSVRRNLRVLSYGNHSVRQQVLDSLARDDHYKYFVVFTIPMAVYFVIANWVGWQYYRNS